EIPERPAQTPKHDLARRGIQCIQVQFFKYRAAHLFEHDDAVGHVSQDSLLYYEQRPLTRHIADEQLPRFEPDSFRATGAADAVEIAIPVFPPRPFHDHGHRLAAEDHFAFEHVAASRAFENFELIRVDA